MRQLRAALLAVAFAAPALAGGLASRAFLPLSTPPPNWLPTGLPSDVGCAIAAREDGLVAVGGWTRQSVYLVDARDPALPRLICEYQLAADTCGLAFEGNSLWVGGDDLNTNPNGLVRLDLAADPFAACPVSAELVPGLASGVTPNIFTTGGRTYAFIVNRWGYANRVVDLQALSIVGSWTPVDADARMSDSHVIVTPSGQVLAAVAAARGGAYVLDLSTPSTPIALAHFDWTFTPPDFDGNPATVDGCDRNGDLDVQECGESGRNGDGRRLNFATSVALAVVQGRVYLVTADGNLAGHVRIWALDDVIASCAGESNSNCPVDEALTNASGPPWPGVDSVALAAWYQVDDCPLAAGGLTVHDSMLFVSYHEAGVHVIDLAAQGLPDSAIGRRAFEMTALATFETLPGGSDTVLENYPCHTLGTSDGCESQNADWNATPCQPSPPASAAFRVVRNAGLRSATASAWAGCHLYVVDQGSPDADGLPAPSHDGTPAGLWILDFDPLPDGVGDSLRVARDGSDALLLSWAASAGIATERHVHRGTLPLAGRGYDHECLQRLTTTSASLPAQVGGTSPAGLYYLVSSPCGTQEGALGQDSANAPIPPGAAPCP